MASTDGGKRVEPFLPITNLTGIMKEACGHEVKVSKEAKEMLMECATEFICFTTLEATKIAAERKRKAVKEEDVLQAAQDLGFQRYQEHLLLFYLTAHPRERVGRHRPGEPRFPYARPRQRLLRRRVPGRAPPGARMRIRV